MASISGDFQTICCCFESIESCFKQDQAKPDVRNALTELNSAISALQTKMSLVPEEHREMGMQLSVLKQKITFLQEVHSEYLGGKKWAALLTDKLVKRIFIWGPGGRQISMECSPSTSIRVIKETAREKLGIQTNPDSFLIINGRQVDDEKQVGDYYEKFNIFGNTSISFPLSLCKP